jgi:uncharacterized protein (DUF169 family)
MPDYKQLHHTLASSLELSQAPVALCLTDALPDGVALWKGTPPAGCRFWQEGATQVFATAASHHELCSIGVYTHNMEMSGPVETDLNDALKVMGDLGYVRAEDVPQIPVLQSKTKYVVYGPLAETPAAPDMVLLFVQANQTLVLSEAAQQLEGGAPPAMGRPACAIVPQAKNSGRTALSLGCCGARAYLDVLTPETAVFAIPGAKLEAFTTQLAALAKANAILAQFHALRRLQVEAGAAPTVKESLAAMGA